MIERTPRQLTQKSKRCKIKVNVEYKQQQNDTKETVIVAVNNILLTNDTIELMGFDLLKTKITFCFYSRGIAIVPEWNTNKLSCHYESSINEQRIIKDPLLAQMLKERGIGTQDSFIRIDNHYIEAIPHGIK